MTTLDHAIPFEESADTVAPRLIEVFAQEIERASTTRFWRDLEEERRRELRRRFTRRMMSADGLDWQALAQLDRAWGADDDS